MRTWTMIVAMLVPGALALRQFSDEYPNITVCEIKMDPRKELYKMPDSLRVLRAHFGGQHKCTHVEGNLIIQNIWDDKSEYNMSFLESIEEVYGMLKMYNNSIDAVILPRLKIIRGEDSDTIHLADGSKRNVSLFLKAKYSKYSKHLLLPSLRVISKHSVYFNSKPEHPYLPHSIDWSQFFEDDSQQMLHTINDKKDAYQCHSSCKLKKNHTYCWSPEESHCQIRTKCQDTHTLSTKWCYFKTKGGETTERYCNEMCIGGCKGGSPRDCEVCRHFTNDNLCISSCPRERTTRDGISQENENFKLTVGRLCASKCPEGLVRQRDACLFRCTVPKFYKVYDTCERCYNASGCGLKECSITEASDGPGYITSGKLETLTTCQIVTGVLRFSTESFDKSKGNVIVPMMYKHLSNVQVIIGSLSIDGSNVSLHNLTFLQNLAKISNTKSGTAALSIFNSDISFLGFRRLRRIHGELFLSGNKNICYEYTILWKDNILRKSQFSVSINDTKCNKSCDAQCGEGGCWGPSSSMCYQCKGLRAGYNCVDRCEDEPGYYTGNNQSKPGPKGEIPYDDGTCQRCHPLCLQNCTGPTADKCVGGCRFYREGPKCVSKCSSVNFHIGKKCFPCHTYCKVFLDWSCTGPGDFVGNGGCRSCDMLSLRGNRTYCGFNACPVGYYPNILYNNKEECLLCTAPCSRCTSSSRSKIGCTECKGFWDKDDCVEKCKNDSSSLVQPQNPGGICQSCHMECDDCYFPENATQCKSCKHRRIITMQNMTQFTCVKVCPPSHNYSRIINKVTVCVTQEEGLKLERDEHVATVMTTIYWILGPAIATLLVASVVMHRVLKKNKKMKATSYLKAVYSNIHEPDSKVLLFNKESKLAQPNMNRLLLIPTTNITFDINGKPLGTGAFGSVYRGVWRLTNQSLLKKEKNELEVAIKVIQVLNQKAMVELLAEAKIMASVCHKHCLRLIGVCLLQTQPCLVTTYMELGSLDKYLKKHQNTLSSFILLSWAEQIADGMAYLEMRGIIHRDLATRNVLVNSSHLVQITDFGLSRILQGTEDNNEIIVTSGQVPVRWLAPETLTMGIYSHKTDVWAYGVTLWEIFTFGERPYNDMPLKDIPLFISQNNRLPQPEICSIETYIEMLNCWKEPQYRSSFQDLMITFSNFCHHPTYYLNIPNDSCLINDQCSSFDRSGHYVETPTNYSAPKFSVWKSFYRQQPSLDGTITTCLEDYPDSEGHSKVNRQVSSTSYMSGQPLLSDDGFSIYPSQSFRLSEAEDESEYLEPKTTIKDDHEYLEPFIGYLKK